jgi:Sulfotransferase family
MMSKELEAATELSEESLLEAAVAQTGLTDWGPGEFLPALRRLLDALEAEANLSRRGRELCRGKLVHHLATRLRVQENHAKAGDAISRQPIVRPLVVVGFPRTGSTLLQNLLALDPRARSLKFWELYSPYALDRELAPGETDPRLVAAAAFVETRPPLLQQAHEVSVHGPEECNWLLKLTFAQWRFYMFFRIPSYMTWLVEQPLIEQYQYYRKQLQLLLWQRPCPPGGHLALKNPNHFGFLGALLAAYPDARVVHVHRDMRSVIASTCSLRRYNQSTYAETVDPLTIGREVVPTMVRFIERGMEARSAARPGQILDLQYNAFVRDPLGTVRCIYAHFGLEMTPEYEARLSGWLARDGESDRPRHKYDLAEFGLRGEAIDETFGFYSESFDVQRARATSTHNRASV